VALVKAALRQKASKPNFFRSRRGRLSPLVDSLGNGGYMES
jgi:hypothetical protein